MLAHQGGWDETLLIVAPLMVVFFLLRLAKRRVERNELRPEETTPAPGTPGRPAGDAPDQQPEA